MRIEILALGKLKERYLDRGVEEYLRRLKPYARVTVTVVPETGFSARPAESKKRLVLAAEAERLGRFIREDTFLVALDPGGEMLDSVEFSQVLDREALTGRSHFTFVIGGPLGLDDSIRARAHLVLSFSRLTFPHQLFRLMLLEQIYRALKIIRGEPYHL
ncbi:MAG: 23S rRNA (pseudouridine(1915)-N(3))-methyltransferase RlmH [Candidatus Desulforudis sp.]|nr:23S rRNA (pseudouridine(1915)-N(3))-methyltransferase RlmH [Desulforudis sp.]